MDENLTVWERLALNLRQNSSTLPVKVHSLWDDLQFSVPLTRCDRHLESFSQPGWLQTSVYIISPKTYVSDYISPLPEILRAQDGSALAKNRTGKI